MIIEIIMKLFMKSKKLSTEKVKRTKKITFKKEQDLSRYGRHSLGNHISYSTAACIFSFYAFS